MRKEQGKLGQERTYVVVSGVSGFLFCFNANSLVWWLVCMQQPKILSSIQLFCIYVYMRAVRALTHLPSVDLCPQHVCVAKLLYKHSNPAFNP